MPRKLNCAPKFDEAVRIPNRLQVKMVLDEFQDTFGNRVLGIDELIEKLGHFIANRFSVNVTRAMAPEVDLGDLNVSAFYDWEDDECCKTSIELVLISNPQEKFLIFSDDLYERLSKIIADSLIHELVHMKQARSRDYAYRDFKHNYSETDERKYLGNPDEIDAYAHNICADFKEISENIKRLNAPSKVSMIESMNLWIYLKAFGHDVSTPVLKRLLKKVYKLLTS